jgi:pseudouridine 5'-phosphatase
VTDTFAMTSTPDTKSAARQIDAIIFDLDGTLLDTEPLSTQAINAVIAEVSSDENCRMGPALKKSIIGMTDDDWSRIIIDSLEINQLITPDRMIERYKTLLADLVATVPKLPGADNIVLEFAKRKMRQAVATSSSLQAVKAKRQLHEPMFAHFELVVTGCDPEVKKGKPNPDIFLLTAKRMDVDPTKCLVFEDSPFGAQAAKAAGMYTVAVPDAGMDKKRYTHADMIIDSLEQFPFTHADYEWQCAS